MPSDRNEPGRHRVDEDAVGRERQRQVLRQARHRGLRRRCTRRSRRTAAWSSAPTRSRCGPTPPARSSGSAAADAAHRAHRADVEGRHPLVVVEVLERRRCRRRPGPAAFTRTLSEPHRSRSCANASRTSDAGREVGRRCRPRRGSRPRASPRPSRRAPPACARAPRPSRPRPRGTRPRRAPCPSIPR